jgi:hypothetical protein
MDKSARVLLVTALMILIACGGRPPDAQKAGFINRSRHSDAELQAIWATAQQSIAQSIDLNPLQQSSPGVPPNVLPGDARAIDIKPTELLVDPIPDVSSQAFFVATGIRRTSPTGMIPCPKPCNARYAPAYSFYQPELTKYAASWDSQPDNFSVILEYEFENHILHTLGYNTKWR